MSLLNPTMGELVDRFQIVRLKMNHLGVQPLLSDELAELFREINKKNQKTNIGDWGNINAVLELNQVHTDLWTAEDDIRATDDVHLIAGLAQKITRLNDRRSELVRQISHLYKENVAPKIYKK